MAIKKKAHEKLDDKNIQRVINALNGEKPITKKEACEMLRINYNTPRLSKIINAYREERAYRQKRMDKNRGKVATEDEKREIISQYLTGMSITAIAKVMYRSTPFIKSFIDNTGVPTRVAEGEEFIVPDECVK
jgi:transposase